MLLGLDIGSSSVKAALVDPHTGRETASAAAPATEMIISAPKPGWAEQDPDAWWSHVIEVLAILRTQQPAALESVKAIGISYQMHGLVCIDKAGKPLRPSIIWCDSRAVGIGQQAFQSLGPEWCLSHLLNSPGNFTASKLRWVSESEPEIFERIHKVMLPGDYIALRLTGEICTTASGLSEGTLWDFQSGSVSNELLDHYGIPTEYLATVKPSFAVQGRVTADAARAMGLPAGVPVSYRAGDQPNNALSLNVLEPGETAATAGTSGVIYSVTDRNASDPESRVNTFLHVNHSSLQSRNGILLCINGTGILNSWMRRLLGDITYDDMNLLASEAPVGSEGLCFLPFGNGAERVMGNLNLGASLSGLDLNRHHRAHMLRAAQEGIVFALAYGFDVLRNIGAETRVVRAGHANLFLSPLFREAFVNTLGVPLELYRTNGAVGAALGAGVGAGIFNNAREAFHGLERMEVNEPRPELTALYNEARHNWEKALSRIN